MFGICLPGYSQQVGAAFFCSLEGLFQFPFLYLANNNERKETGNINITETDILTVLQVEKDEERLAMAAEYNEILTNKETTTEEKNNAYNGLKALEEIKAKEESLKKKLKELPGRIREIRLTAHYDSSENRQWFRERRRYQVEFRQIPSLQRRQDHPAL